MSRAPSTGSGNSYTVGPVHRLTIAPVPETPCRTSLATSSAEDSDDNVQISLGIQQSITQAWGAALDRLGSMSLAWQSEAAFAQGSLTQPVDPGLIFDRVSRPAPLLAVGPPEKPTDFGGRLHRDKNVVAPAVPAWHLKGPPSIILEEGVAADHGRLANGCKPGNVLPVLPARYATSSGIPTNLALSPSTRAARKMPGHRLSIKLERLLPPRTPDSGKVELHTLTLSARSARGTSSCYSVPPDQVAGRRRASSNPQPAAKGAKLVRRRGATDTVSSTAITSRQQMHASPAFDRARSTESLHAEERLASLEAQVSDMFCELGLRSPYIQASRLVEQRTLTGSVHRGPEQMPWFYQKQYAKHTALEDRLVRHIVLADDDSSCPDNATEPSIRCHSRNACQHREAAQMAFPGLHVRRRPTSASMLSAADESTCSTSAESGLNSSAHTRRAYEYENLSAYSDHDSLTHQVHSIQQRIERADQYIHSASRHASAISNMLADLCTQSRALVDTLATSQARKLPLRSQLPVTNQLLHPGHKTANHADNLAATRLPRGTKTTSTYQAAHGRVSAQQRGRNAIMCSREVAECCNVEAGSPEALKPARHIRGAKQAKCNSPVQHRRPVQPVSVRLQRIDAQWGELRSAIASLGITVASTDTAKKHSARHSATEIAVGGLKSIQRVLKTTLESLGALDAQKVLRSSSLLADPRPV